MNYWTAMAMSLALLALARTSPANWYGVCALVASMGWLMVACRLLFKEK